MARAQDERVTKARKLFKSGMKLIEIANQLNIPAGTVRRWKSTYKWDNERSDKKANARKRKSDPVAEEVKLVIENTELTDKQRLFCLYYIKCFNATKAYQKAHECCYKTAAVEGCKYLRNPKIKEQIKILMQGRFNRELLSEDDIVQRYIEIAFADITDYVDFGTREVIFSNSDGMEATTEMSYVDAKPSCMVDGSLLSEVSMGKSGIKIKLPDRLKAMQWLSDHMDLLTTEQKFGVQHMQGMDRLEKEKFDLQKAQYERNSF